LKNPELILVTGVAGFIGFHTCNKLLLDGYEVLGIDNLNDYYDPALKEHNVNSLQYYSNFKFVQADIRDYGILLSLFRNQQIGAIFHLAAQVGVRYSLENPFVYHQVNVGGTLNLLEVCHHFNVRNFTYASSSSVYGNQQKVPFSEEDTISKPVSIYAATKQAGEALCYIYHHLYDIIINCLRFFTVYGPHGRPDMSPHVFTEKILNEEKIVLFDNPSGTIKRDYTYISDIVDGITKALAYEDGFQVFNLGHGSPIKLMDFINILEEITGKTALVKHGPRQPGDVDITYADISKAKQLLGYQPEINVRDGLEKYVNWFIDFYNKK
jgi:UDP-glucuronate 4-epimerase